MAENGDALWAKMQRTMDFILEQQAASSVRQAQFEESHARFEENHAKFEEHTRRAIEQHDREMGEIRKRLSRAVRLGVREVRRERKQRQDLSAQLEALGKKIDGFIDSMNRGGNGSH